MGEAWDRVVAPMLDGTAEGVDHVPDDFALTAPALMGSVVALRRLIRHVSAGDPEAATILIAELRRYVEAAASAADNVTEIEQVTGRGLFLVHHGNDRPLRWDSRRAGPCPASCAFGVPPVLGPDNEDPRS